MFWLKGNGVVSVFSDNHITADILSDVAGNKSGYSRSLFARQLQKTK